MKRYFDLKDFITFLNLLEDNKVTPLFTESVEDGSIEKYNFMKMMFSDNTIILYDHPMCQIGIIQDSPVAPWDDYAESVYEDLTMSDEYKLFIEA
jgi:hypothetical protein